MARTSLITPSGKAEWAKIFVPENSMDAGKPREWSISLLLDPADGRTLDFSTILEEMAFEQFGKNWKPGPNSWPFRDHMPKNAAGSKEATGLMEFRFKRNEHNQAGVIVPGPVVIDAKLNPWPADKLVGNGSTVKVEFSPILWDNSFGRGLGLRLEAVQILDLVEYQSCAQGAGFVAEDGYTVEPEHGTGFTAEAEPERALTVLERMRAKQAEPLPDDMPF